MSEKPNKTLIGAFVLGALALLLLAVAVISSGRLFSTPLRFVLFFESSLKGLSVGSPVITHGVPWGRVTAIRMAGDVNTLEFLIPVYVELDTSILKDLKNLPSTPAIDAPYLNKMMQRGFRGRLNSQSLLTGQLLIELDYFPDAQRQDSFMPMPVYDSLLVIPTIPSPFETVSQRLSELPVERLVQNLIDILEKTDNILGSQAIKDLPGNLNSAVVEARATFDAINTTMRSISHLAASLDSVAGMVDKQTPGVLERARRLIDTYTALADHLERSLESVRGVVGPNTAAVLEFTRAIREIGETAKALRGLAGMLERNPEALLLGKGVYRK